MLGFNHGLKTAARNSSRTQPQRTLLGRAAKPARPLRRATTAVLILGTGAILIPYYLDARSALHSYVLTPLLRNLLDSEDSHKVAVKVLSSGIAPKDVGEDDERLAVKLWDHVISNPIGLAAGFDKNGEAIDGLFDLGFSWVEIGSVTPKPQPGNPRPRVFHLPADQALINRYGFPSDGSQTVLDRLQKRIRDYVYYYHPSFDIQKDHASLRKGQLLAVNLGKNKASPADSIEDFLDGIRTFGPLADAVVINVSSPNTPGLRSLQSEKKIEQLITSAVSERNKLPGRKPRLLIKLAPDLTEHELEDIASAIGTAPPIDGVIVSNTTIQRPAGLISDNRSEIGGLSGPPLFPLSLKALQKLRSLLPESILLIGCGGISSGADALEYAKSGASFVQIYTSFGYGGAGTARRIKDELSEELQREGKTWSEVSSEAVRKLSAKGFPKQNSTRTTDLGKDLGELTVESVLKEAEHLRGLLEDFEKRLEH
ncbi:hypothetical protein SISNIDRAFT_414926 [Sistotremastrum niveocremeum HHB9708]|uniref:Dihydroorotate dehydrogenase (quinone), mitochondrial n=1 Tax=Sistotremastrum niveocremeum HHB9708 TaxID=1314777 RepID=A0A164RPA4_9AGAM|nr:hypothetical protein SISNIDRAFT_414926 [Sistotremastrum niveocremeum HHB9708]